MKKLILFLVIVFCFCSTAQATYLQNKNFPIEVARGNVSGVSAVNIFGKNDATSSGEDIWAGSTAYGFYPTEAVTVDIKSTDVDDDGDPIDTGCRTVAVYGLDNNWDEQNETVTLNGQTEVALSNEYIRIWLAVCLTAGSTGTNEGNITVQSSEAAGGIADNTVGAYIAIGKGGTQQCIYTIPNNKTGYFIKGYVGISDDDKNGEVAKFEWQAKLNNGISGAWVAKGDISTINIGSGWWQYQYGVPAGPLPEKTDVRIQTPLTTAEVGTVCGFDILLIDDGF